MTPRGIAFYPITDYRDHRCIRECDGTPMLCEYNFTLESYYTMSKACYGCPFNITDCYRPHCVAANGYPRYVQTANRQIPGPAIQVKRLPFDEMYE